MFIVLTRLVCSRVDLVLSGLDGADVVLLGSALLLSRAPVRVRYPLFQRVFATYEALVLVAYVGLHAMPLSYAVQKFGSPLQDGTLIAFDRTLGFDCVAFMTWAAGHGRVYELLGKMYQQFPYVALAVFACGMIFHPGQDVGPRFLVSFIIAVLLTALVSALIPAYGAVILLDPTLASGAVGATPVAHLDALRSGLMREMPAQMGGLISFPSMHAGLGLLILHSLRRSWLLPLFAPHALVFMLTALTHGGHYLADCLAALPLAAASIWLSQALLAGRRSTAKSREVTGAATLAGRPV